LKKIKTAWGPPSAARSEPRANCIRTAPTSLRQRPPPPCRAHGTTAAASPPTVSTASSNASSSYKGHPPLERPFPPPPPSPPLRRLARHCQAAADSPLQPLSDRLDPTPSVAPSSISSPTALTQLMTPTLACWPLFPAADPLHCGQASLVSFFLPAAPKLVHHPTALLPEPSSLHLVTGTAGIRPGRRRPAPWEQAPLPLDFGPNGQVGWEPLAELARLVP
jgi:hypothetical protein